MCTPISITSLDTDAEDAHDSAQLQVFQGMLDGKTMAPLGKEAHKHQERLQLQRRQQAEPVRKQQLVQQQQMLEQQRQQEQRQSTIEGFGRPV